MCTKLDILVAKGISLDSPTQMIDKSNFDQRQYKADTDTAYECGRASVLSVIDDIKTEIETEKEKEKAEINYGKVYVYNKCLEIIDKYIRKE